MVAKLSSVRIIAAASLETSVPVMPIAIPMSDCFSAGASLTPSPVIATTWPLRLRMSTTRTLCSGVTRAVRDGEEPALLLGRHARDHADPVDLPVGLLVRHLRELRSRDRTAFDAELPRDRARRDRVV